MLVSFAFNNVKSFREWKELSLVSTSKIQGESDHEISEGRLTVLKNAGIFGANASGKSNLIKGFAIAKEFVATGRISERSIAFLDDTDKESSFSFTFLVDDILFSYGFSIKPSGVLSNLFVCDETIEILNKDGSVKTTIYSKNENHFLGDSDPVLKVFYNRYFSNPNVLFLTYMNSPEKIMLDNKISRLMNRIFNFFVFDLVVVESFSNNYSIINDSNIEKITNKLKEYDTGIDNAKFVKDDRQDFLRKVPAQIINILINDPNANKLSIANEDELVCINKTIDGMFEVQKLVINHKNIQSSFTFHDESHGTKRLFYLIGLLLGGNLNNKVFVIDEIEKGCHPNLIEKLISDFQDYNKASNAQLIFTSHLSSLMEDVLRRDEVYFVEKDNEGVSNIYSLIDYKDRSTSLAKRYLEGRFGAVPKLGVKIDASNI